MIDIPVFLVGAVFSYATNPHYIHQFGMTEGLCLHALVGIGMQCGTSFGKKILAPGMSISSAIVIGATGGYFGGKYLVDNYVVTGKLKKNVEHFYMEMTHGNKTLGRILSMPDGRVYACLSSPKMG